LKQVNKAQEPFYEEITPKPTDDNQQIKLQENQSYETVMKSIIVVQPCLAYQYPKSLAC